MGVRQKPKGIFGGNPDDLGYKLLMGCISSAIGASLIWGMVFLLHILKSASWLDLIL